MMRAGLMKRPYDASKFTPELLRALGFMPSGLVPVPEVRPEVRLRQEHGQRTCSINSLGQDSGAITKRVSTDVAGNRDRHGKPEAAELQENCELPPRAGPCQSGPSKPIVTQPCRQTTTAVMAQDQVPVPKVNEPSLGTPRCASLDQAFCREPLRIENLAGERLRRPGWRADKVTTLLSMDIQMHHRPPLTAAEPPRRLCVFRLSAIGDCCNMVPIVRTLQAHLPETSITWVMGRVEANLLGDLDGVEVITHAKKSGTGTLHRRLNGRDFDALLLMQVALRAGLASRAVRAPVRIGFDRARSRDGHRFFVNHRIAKARPGHVIDGFFGFCEALGIQERCLRWDIPISDMARERAQAWLAELEASVCGESVADAAREAMPVLLISPCSSSRFRNFRNWSAECYAEVARHAASVHGMRVILTGGGSRLEQDYAARIIEAVGHGSREKVPVPILDLVGRTDLQTLFALIERSTAVLAPDSGPVHMAVAAGTPAIGLYASSNPERTGPVLGRRWVVNAYPDAVEQSLGCRVSEVRWGRRVRDPHAMALIKPEHVIARLDELMATPPSQRLRQ